MNRTEYFTEFDRSTPTTAVGRLVRTTRIERRESARTLAERAGCSLSTASRIESGTRNPSRDLCVAVARALQMDPDVLLVAAGFLPRHLVEAIEAGQLSPHAVADQLMYVEGEAA